MADAKVEIIVTEDGSHTLFVPELNETYHSIHGAIQESRHVFIKEGLEHFILASKSKEIKILEIGFGNICKTVQSNANLIKR